MKQSNTIKKINGIFKSCDGVRSCILIGSFGRGKPRYNSDIDYQLLVNEKFNHKDFISLIQKKIGDELKYSIHVKRKKKYIFYGENYSKIIDVFICEKLEDLDKYYLGSEIEDIEKSIVFDNTGEVKTHLQKITNDKIANQKRNAQITLENLIIDFQISFENASSKHFKSDGYKFYVSFSHALNALVRMVYICEGGTTKTYMPPNFLTDYSRPNKLKIEELEKIMDLRESNKNKKILLDLFKKYLPIAIKKFDLVNIDSDTVFLFCDEIFKRDYFWNFRDASKFDSKIKSGVLFRTSALTRYQETPSLKDLLQKYNITNIIDLRAKKELKEHPYTLHSLENFSYTHAPFDPWSQSEAFKKKYSTETNNQKKAYLFFIEECKPSIKIIVERILKNKKGATAIHCHAGKDRTGVIFTLFHLLVGANTEEIERDYLASEMDTDLKLLRIVLEYVEKEGGILAYLKSCKLTEKQISELKEKIITPNIL